MVIAWCVTSARSLLPGESAKKARSSANAMTGGPAFGLLKSPWAKTSSTTGKLVARRKFAHNSARRRKTADIDAVKATRVTKANYRVTKATFVTGTDGCDNKKRLKC